MTGKTRYFIVASLLTTMVGVGAGLVAYYRGIQHVGSRAEVERAELRLVPSSATLVAFADVQAIMASELRQRLRRVIPMHENAQEDFERKTGISIERDIDHVVAALVPPARDDGRLPASMLVLARGRLDATRVEALMRQHGATAEAHRGTAVFSAGGGAEPDGSPKGNVFALTFVEPGLVAVGSPHLVRGALDLREGGSNITSNLDVIDLLRTVEGDVWAVGLFDALREQARLPPEILRRLPPVTRFSASGRVNDGLHGVIRADATDEQSANEWRDVVRGVLALARLQGAQRPEIQGLVDAFELGGTGRTIALSFSLPASLFDRLASGSEPAQ